MILLFNNIPVKLKRKVEIMISTAQSILGSEFFNTAGSRWLGDRLTIESLFPKWIIKKANENPSEVLIVQFIKSFQRWLFDLEMGYGAAVPWETIHVPQKIPNKLLLGLADLYFPRFDMSGEDFADILPNLKKFSIKVEENYFRKKGSPEAIQYLLISLLGVPYESCEVVSGSPGFLIVRANIDLKYRNFLNKCVYPAGITVLYESV